MGHFKHNSTIKSWDIQASQHAQVQYCLGYTRMLHDDLEQRAKGMCSYFDNFKNIIRQETAKGGKTRLQSGNIIGKDPPRTNIYAELNIKYCMTLNRQSQG